MRNAALCRGNRKFPAKLNAQSKLAIRPAVEISFMHLQAVGKKHTQVEQMSEHLKQSVEAVHFGIMGEVDADAGAQMIKPANFDRQTIRL